MEELQKHLNLAWKGIRKLVIEHKFTEARITSKNICDTFKYGPCAECSAQKVNICGAGRSAARKFCGACVLESEDLALRYADKIIQWTET